MARPPQSMELGLSDFLQMKTLKYFDMIMINDKSCLPHVQPEIMKYQRVMLACVFLDC